jgi:HAD superfamily hydrolase (TIGR01509 family)
VRGAVFDCDGLLVDTTELWWAAFEATANSLGHSIDGIDPTLLRGASVPLAAARIGESLGCEVSEAGLLGALTTLIESHPIAAMPGAETLLEELAGWLPLAVATNAPSDIAEAVLRRTGLRRYFGPLISAEQTAEPKPAPDVYIEACRQLDLRPVEAVAFEDSVLGAQSARAARMTVVGVPLNGDRLEADLIVPRLDHGRVFDLLGIGEILNDAPEAAGRRESAEASNRVGQ